MKLTKTLSFLLASALALGCGTEQDGGDPPPPADAAGNQATDGANNPAPDAQENVRIPTWALEDIQPESPMFGQTYGLEAFSGSIVVMVLVEGF